MRYIELICQVAGELFDGEARVGVRLSPVHIEADEAHALVEFARRTMGDRAFVAVAVPGAAEAEGERWCVSSGERAAEMATSWRNRVRTEVGERVLYVSATRLGKEGGLVDVLYALTEDELRRGFLKRVGESSEALRVVMAKLREAGLHETTSARALCEFAAAVASAPPARALEAAGQALPILDLAVDTALAEDPVARLKANQRMVTEAARAERKSRNTPVAVSCKQRELSSALRHGQGTAREQLGRVDLGALRTADLEPKRATRPRTPRPPRPPAPPPGAGTARAAPPARPSMAGEPAGPVAPLVAWDADDQRRELGVPARLPDGLRAHLLRSLEGPGEALVWTAGSEDLRDIALSPPKGLAEPARHAYTGAEGGGLQPLVAAWRERRAALIDHLGALLPAAGWLDGLVSTPLVVLSQPTTRALASALVDAAVALYTAAFDVDDAALSGWVLHLETLTFASPPREDGARTSLVIFGPLHPLWLGQALARLHQLDEARSVAPIARRLIARSFHQAPVAPSLWPALTGGEMELSQQLAGLLTFETERREVSEEACAAAAGHALARLLEQHPHALLGPRLVLQGRAAGAAIGGVADAVAAARTSPPECAAAQVFTAGSSAGDDGLQRAIERGLVTLAPLPGGDDPAGRVDPHIELVFEPRVGSGPAARLDPGPPTLAVDPVGAQTRFTLTSRGLVASTPVRGIPAVQAVERLLAAIRATPPTGAFHRERPVTDLAAVFPRAPRSPSTWQVAVAARLSRRPRPDAWLLMHEEIDGADVAVVVSDLGAAARAIEAPLVAMGVNERRPSTLRLIAQGIAAQGRGGLLSLTSSHARVLASQLLGFVLRHASGPDAVIAHIDGTHLRTILGTDGSDDPHGAVALGLSVTPLGVRVRLGYANLMKPPGADAVEGALVGPLADRLGRVLHLLELAGGEAHGGFAAREALGWLVWSSVALEGTAPDGLGEALTARHGEWLQVDGVQVLVPPGHGLLGGEVRTVQGYVCAMEAADHRLLGRVVVG